MDLQSIIFELAVIVVGASIVGTLFLYAKQPIIIAYIAVGFLVGPGMFGLIKSPEQIENISHFGVILLLFLIGLNLQPKKLVRLFKETAAITFGSSILFGGLGLFAGKVLGFDLRSAAIFGAAMMFSSTVVGLKLIPTTTLHHRRTGEMMTSILLLQDMLAILVILFVTGKQSDQVLIGFILLVAKFALLCLLAFAGVRYVVIPLFKKFDVVQEYTFLTTLAWCLLWAETADLAGLSYEMGAFVAGLSIASCPVALVIAEHLKPLREFFLILFFFSVGSRLDLGLEPRLLFGALAIGVILVPLKAVVFRLAFRKTNEKDSLKHELASRLAQSSEFSLLLVFSAASTGAISSDAAIVTQIATIVTFVVSTYWVVSKYPTPISKNAALRQD